MEIFICYLVIYIIEALIIWQYCINMFSSKLSAKITACASIIIYTIPFLTVFQKNIWINALSFTLANFIYMAILFRTRWYNALFHSIISTIIMTVSELFVVGLISNLAYDFYAEASHFCNLAILTVLSKMLYFFILQIIIFVFCKYKQNSESYNFSISILTIVPIISLFISLSLISLSVDIVLSTTHDRMIAASAFLLLIINIIVFGIYNYNQKRSHEFTELQIQFQREYDSAEYYKMLAQQHEDQNILIHDIKKHLNAISLLLEQEKLTEIQTYIDRIISSDLRSSVRVSDNEMLNALLSRYLRLSQDKHIEFRPDIRSGCVNFMEENDLTALFGNLLDNAVESAEKQENSFIELSISKKERTPFTLLTMTNSCRIDPFSPETGALITRKKDKLRHGYGVKSIKRIVEKYNGDMQMYYDKETITFHTIITLKNLSQ